MTFGNTITSGIQGSMVIFQICRVVKTAIARSTWRNELERCGTARAASNWFSGLGSWELADGTACARRLPCFGGYTLIAPTIWRLRLFARDQPSGLAGVVWR